AEDRAYGNPVQVAEVKDFREWIVSSGIVEMKTIGRRYTWTNNHVCSKIDWVSCNSAWMNYFPLIEAMPDYSQGVHIKSGGSIQGNIWNKHKNVRDAMKLLNRMEFSNASQRVREAKDKLQEVQTSMLECSLSAKLIAAEKEAKEQLDK
ncbi:hypothetical protein HAX54_022664, partial [Datura stramonium]|nr:hypothetical protein [Datura stramonium]